MFAETGILPAQKGHKQSCGDLRRSHIYIYIYIYMYVYVYVYVLLDRLLSTGRLATPARPVTYLYHN